MKKICSLMLILLLATLLFSCTKIPNKVMYLEGKVTEITDSGVIVKITDSGTSNISKGASAFFGAKEPEFFSVSDEVMLTFSGSVTETDPLRFEGPYQLEIIRKAPNISEKHLHNFYQSKIREYKNASTMSDDEFEACNIDINKLMMNFYRNSDEFEFSWSTFDIDKNGTDELIILANGEIIDIYTVKDEAIIRLLPYDYGERTHLWVLSDGKLMVEGAHSAFMSSCSFYKIENGNDITKERAVYYSSDDNTDGLGDNYEKLDIEEYVTLIDESKEKSITHNLRTTVFLVKSKNTIEDKNFANEIENVQYIRTDGYNNFFTQNYLVRITSKDELDNYNNYFSGIYNLAPANTIYADTTIGFADAIKSYSSTFFDSHDLYMAVIQEGSGSIRHKVEGFENGYIKIDTITPQVCTADMANWHIILEVEKGAQILGINEKQVPIYTPEEANQKVVNTLKITAFNWLKETFNVTDATILEISKEKWGDVKELDFENPYGYNPGYDESPVWTFDFSSDIQGEFRLFLSESIVFGYKKAETKDDTIEKQISTAIYNHYKSEKPDGLIAVESHFTLLVNTENNHTTTVYLLTLYEKYNFDTQIVSSLCSPIAITFNVDESGNYNVSDFWECEPGESYETSLKNKFPQKAIDELNKIEKPTEKLQEENIIKLNEIIEKIKDGHQSVFCVLYK